MAWLNATPKPPPGSQRAKAAEKSKPLSRRDQMKKDGITPQMPPNPMPHLISFFIEIGMTESTGMGPSPLSWREINEWQHATRVRLAPWEARLIRSLSLAYVAETGKAESENYPSPIRTEVTAREREVEEANLRNLLG